MFQSNLMKQKYFSPPLSSKVQLDRPGGTQYRQTATLLYLRYFTIKLKRNTYLLVLLVLLATIMGQLPAASLLNLPYQVSANPGLESAS